MSYIDSACRDGADGYVDFQVRYLSNSRLIRQALQAADEVTGAMLLAEGYEPGPKLGEILFQRRVERFKKQTLRFP